MIFCVSVFIFCLEPTVREQLDEKNFRHCYGIFIDNNILKLLWSNHVQSSFATITRHFDNAIWNDTLQLKILQTCISIWSNFFLSKNLQTKIGEGVWKIIIYAIIQACSSKNIAPINFAHYCMLFFSRINYIALFRSFLPQFTYLFTFDILCILELIQSLQKFL